MLDFPVWLRVAHLINVIFIILIIRSGIEILSAHPRLYLTDHTADGKEILKFSKKKMPRDKLWTSTDEEESYNSFVALPGHSNLGLGRHWHFFSIIFWIANGIAYYVLLLATGAWQTIVPTSWSIFPGAIQTMLIFASGKLPPPGNPFDPAQQLAYFGVVFVLGPLLIITGAAMSPSVDARFPNYPRVFGGRQVARSLHFILMILLVLFIITHIALVLIDRFPDNMANIIIGGGTMSIGFATFFFLAYVVVVVAVNYYATEKSLRSPGAVQRALGALIEPVRSFLFERASSKQKVYTKKDWSQYFTVNGRPPTTKEYSELLLHDFKDYKLTVYGLVHEPRNFTLDEIKAFPKQRQTTEHQCIQGWTDIGEWGGVPVREILSICKPLPSAKYVVFHSMGSGEKDEFGHGDPNRNYHEIISLKVANHDQTILAYEMNEKPLPVEHGAPLRLRVETMMGYKMVKWLTSLELIEDYRKYEGGQGGYREDVQYYGIGAEI